MRPRLVSRRVHITPKRPSTLRLRPIFASSSHGTLYTSSSSSSSSSRPLVPFLSTPRSVRKAVRHFSAERKQWLKHEAKIFVRFTAAFWGVAVAGFVIWFAIDQEKLEREYPTPHEWGYVTRKVMRDAHKWMDRSRHGGGVDWVQVLQLARGTLVKLEDPTWGRKQDSEGLVILSEIDDPMQAARNEFAPRDISSKSEEWKRGYFEAIMMAARAAEHVDGWLFDSKGKGVCPPEHVVGPSNPRPKPLPPGAPPAPREEDCETAFPTADRWYLKAMGTEGFSSRQKIQIAIAYALFMEFKKRPDGPDALYNYALAQATQGLDQSALPYHTKTLVLKDNSKQSGPPSLNILDTLTAIASHKARQRDTASALPIYISLLKATRSLSPTAPRVPHIKPKNPPLHRRLLNLLSPPEYPLAPPDGTQPPWRSPMERCREASLHLYIGEILYAASPASRDDGLAWTRDGVDLAEDQLRTLNSKPRPTREDVEARQMFKACLSTGLSNWATMVTRLSREERARKAGLSTGGPSKWSFWRRPDDGQMEGRWEAEENVVKDRVRRTKELVEDLRKPDTGIATFFKA